MPDKEVLTEIEKIEKVIEKEEEELERSLGMVEENEETDPKTEKSKKHIEEESCLFRIPILGYILRKIKTRRKAIEKTLKTGKKAKKKK